jgi:hypothetical protein
MAEMWEIYGSTGLVAGVAQLFYLGVAFGLGGHLTARAGRGGGLPQRLLGLHLILAMGAGYVLITPPLVAAETGTALPPAASAALVGSGYLATVLGLVAVLAFNCRVFHPGDARVRTVAAVLAAIMLGGWLDYGLRGGFSTFLGGAGGWTMMAGIVGANLWAAIDPLRYWVLMRRRLRLGLAEPLVVDRFLLWGAGSLARTLMALIGVVTSAFLLRLDPAALLAASPPVLVLASVCGTATSVAYWVALRPPRFYLRWRAA